MCLDIDIHMAYVQRGSYKSYNSLPCYNIIFQRVSGPGWKCKPIFRSRSSRAYSKERFSTFVDILQKKEHIVVCKHGEE